jgi:hypothetical protein
MNTYKVPFGVGRDFLADAVNTKLINKREERRALDRWCRDGYLKVELAGGAVVTVTKDAAECDCGKGLLCPLNIQRFA